MIKKENKIIDLKGANSTMKHDEAGTCALLGNGSGVHTVRMCRIRCG